MSVSVDSLLILLGAFSTSPELAFTIDAFVPVYTAVAVAIIWGVYKEDSQRKPPSPSASSASSSSSLISPPSSPSASSTSSTSKKNPPSISLTGSYKLIKNIHYQEFLACQGVGWALRKAADSANTTHTITHNTQTGDFRLDVKGLISSSMDYKVYGPPIATQIKDKSFVDTVEYLPDGLGIRIHKVNKKDKYDIIVERRLKGDEIEMKQRVVFKDNREGKEAVQIFKRI
ncbi:hypothetical protein TrLO_g10611 [Triparma laevis f. longispina]|uniref:Uncharacterized protein n=1 Tax=Triparma laevis f. longispina TaxID=1714387 RepID=A0A9W7AR21_9STRA|nr:hypothetical protein TrLO_g10611 [Triparma laevis f. longispina]